MMIQDLGLRSIEETQVSRESHSCVTDEEVVLQRVRDYWINKEKFDRLEKKLRGYVDLFT